MNPTLRKFGYPESLIFDSEHWVVLIRPVQVTLGSVIIAAKSDATSFGALRPEEMAEWPGIIRRFESTIARNFNAEKFNYLALMMVDPNPHFHGIPRYRGPVVFQQQSFTDENFPKPPSLDVVNECSKERLAALRDLLSSSFAS
jgi:Diadenosine tetraphosphate (Ap4A) hydrolase and other HIT family hydrolases